MSEPLKAPNKAAIVGGGVIGGGWAARFLLNGWEVHLFDPAPDAEEKIKHVIDNARASLPQLSDLPMPNEGQLVITGELREAVAGAHWIQESVPERLDLKHDVLKHIQQHASVDAIVASSTSGFTPSQLRQGAVRAEQIIVAHPFNPVYLLPVVELVAGESAGEERVERAIDLLSGIGMKPIAIRKEIDAHVADRLLEAVWREALWLVNDGIATTQDIDDIIRYGFGLRWAQMGLFETYRLAGGEEGMVHFLRQFGPALKWPWTKLMDVPELTDELINTIATQSDQQSGHHSIRDLERIRDQNLVGILRALKDRAWGAGQLLAEHEAGKRDALVDSAFKHQGDDQTIDDISIVSTEGHAKAGPLRLMNVTVLPSWIDYNGHMTEFRYLQVFGDTSDKLLQLIGVNLEYVASGFSYYTVETHIMHIGEAKLGQPLYCTTQVLHVDTKRLHVFHCIHRQDNDEVIATAEQMLLHVDGNEGKVIAATGAVLGKLNTIASEHAKLPQPNTAGRSVGQR